MQLKLRATAFTNIYIIVAFGTLINISSCHTHDHSADSAQGDEEVSISVTRWTENIELFVEFPPFVIGKESRFVAHFTDLKTYLPISEAKVNVSLQGENGVSESVNSPIRPGIFTPVLVPKQAGRFQLKFEITYGDISESIDAGQVSVYTSLEEAIANIPEANEGNITFLKEQAWNTKFSVRPVVRQVVKERISVAGEVVSNPSKTTTISSTAGGMLVFSRDYLPGIFVNRNERVGIIVGKDIVAGVNAEENLQHVFLNAKAALAQAKANYERQKQLYEEKVISTLEFEQHQLIFNLSHLEFQTISNNYVESIGGIELFANTSGYVDDVDAQSGDYLEVGERILSIIPANNKLLQLDVPVKYYSKKDSITNIRWQDEGKWHEDDAKVVSFSQQIDPGDAFFPIWFNVSQINAVPGKYVQAEIVFGTYDVESNVVPTQSILEDYGIYSVIVQITGESFEKREITAGKRNSEYTEILDGLQEGEMVVIDGAYQVKMAGMSGEAPVHGHEH